MEILPALQAKWENHQAMQAKMAGLMRQYGLNNRAIRKKWKGASAWSGWKCGEAISGR